MEAGDPRWQGTREQEKRLAKKFCVAFRRGEDDETRYAMLAKEVASDVQGRNIERRLASE